MTSAQIFPIKKYNKILPDPSLPSNHPHLFTATHLENVIHSLYLPPKCPHHQTSTPIVPLDLFTLGSPLTSSLLDLLDTLHFSSFLSHQQLLLLLATCALYRASVISYSPGFASFPLAIFFPASFADVSCSASVSCWFLPRFCPHSTLSP